jgi:hypothetical protein
MALQVVTALRIEIVLGDMKNAPLPANPCRSAEGSSSGMYFMRVNRSLLFCQDYIIFVNKYNFW